MSLNMATQTFTVPSTANAYAPERLLIQHRETARGGILSLSTFTRLKATGSVAEIWLLKPGGNPLNDADFVLSSASVCQSFTQGSLATVSLSGWPAAQIRVYNISGTAVTPSPIIDVAVS